MFASLFEPTESVLEWYLHACMVLLRSHVNLHASTLACSRFPTGLYFADSLAARQTVLKRVLLHASVRVHNQNPTVILHAPGWEARRTLCSHTRTPPVLVVEGTLWFHQAQRSLSVRYMHGPGTHKQCSNAKSFCDFLTREAGAHCRTSHFRD